MSKTPREDRKKGGQKRPPNWLPTMKIIRSGCYIDFEGFAGNEHQSSPSPVLIGILRDGQFRQVVFTNQYRRAAEESGVDRKVRFCSDRAAFLKELVANAKASTPILAHSEHELTVIESQLGHKITKRYRNVRSIATKWFNKQRDGHAKPETNALRDVAETLEIPMPGELKKGGASGQGIRGVGHAVQKMVLLR